MNPKSEILLVTGCTSTKSAAPADGLRMSDLAGLDREALVSAWCAAARLAAPAGRADEVYTGRNAVYARSAAKGMRADLFYASAGLGLVGADEPIPSYDATFALGTPNSISRGGRSSIRPEWWWDRVCRELRGGPGLLDAARGRRLVVVALSAPYLAAVAGELAKVAALPGAPLRVLTATAPDLVDAGIRRWVMPYDARLNRPESPFRGTIADHANRAARHFASVVREVADGDAEAHVAKVEASLGPRAGSVSP